MANDQERSKSSRAGDMPPAFLSDLAIRPAHARDLDAIASLHERAFGPGRFALTAYRIREGTPPISPFCRVAHVGDKMLGAVRFTAITVGGQSGALLLGPLAVEPGFVNKGVGRELIASGLSGARDAGLRVVLLVGDRSYYGRFGFNRLPPGQVRFPGPVDPARLLAAELTPESAAGFTGDVRAAA